MSQVLIVDDSPTEIHILTTILQKLGHSVQVANNGEEGIVRAKELKPDLILMDVVMPGMNGFQATRTISREPATQHIPVIMCTTKDQETDNIWGMRQGAHDYMVKPVDEAALLANIAALG